MTTSAWEAFRRASQQAVEGSPLPTAAIVGPTRAIVYANPAFCTLLGKRLEEILERSFEQAMPDTEGDASRELLDRVFATGVAESLSDQKRLAILTPVYWSYTAWAIRDPQKRSLGAMIQVTDTTQAALQRQVSGALNQALLLSALRQNELVETVETLNARLNRSMQEMHHRLRNNLQVIVALVEMPLGDGATDIHLRRISRYIRILVSLNDLLMHRAKVSDEVMCVGTTLVLERLIEMLRETSSGRRIRASFADIALPVQQVVALSLIISECVANAIRHAQGEIEITLELEGDRARLETCDRGPGFPSDFDPHTAANMGLDLIDSMVRFDLRGDVRYENRSPHGGRVLVTFPIG